ncbi:Coenzyme PQQ synthesis protein D (PqqD) [Pseudobutyrivibrio sp. YE44]|uniref:PqqD family protein n=1 Tax=Pseudobutyrivibrio sp. YE44 TaxID=1520802 RepID=UPI00088D289F|nr:PqqD family protein [Pseudobutyrivibrio sp. YE44]SDB25075.1 Coenzyme PQQ synthesis protein D (PqqD) [Pseudobutyrivibrio sp. YE44]
MNNKENFLDHVFKISDSISWTEDESGQVVVEMENKGFTNRIAQRFFKKPHTSFITLEGLGSFIFKCIDGKRSVYDIGLLVHDKYGDEAEPLYERLSVYMKHLEQVGFVNKA